ncbi:MAG: MFS transporter [Fibrobacterota bacterium]
MNTANIPTDGYPGSKSVQLKRRIRVALLLVMGGFSVMGGGLVAPALPALQNTFDVSEGALGLVLSVYTLAAALTLPFTGLFVDVLGRKRVGTACLIIDGSCGVLCIFAPDFGVLLILRFIQGIGLAGLIPVVMTIVSDWYAGENRLRIMGFLSSTIAMAAVVIPLAGGVLAQIDWRLSFGMYVFPLILAPFFVMLIPESAPSQKDIAEKVNVSDYLLQLRKSLHLSSVRGVFIHSFGTFFQLYAFVTFVPLLITSYFDGGTALAGAAIAIHGVVAAIAAGYAVTINRRVGRSSALLLGYTLLAGSLFLLPLWSNVWWSALSFVAFGAGMGILQPLIFNWVTTTAPPEMRGSIVALFNTCKYAGMTAAPLVLQFFYTLGGIPFVFSAAAAAALIWAAHGWWCTKEQKTAGL